MNATDKAMATETPHTRPVRCDRCGATCPANDHLVVMVAAPRDGDQLSYALCGWACAIQLALRAPGAS